MRRSDPAPQRRQAALKGLRYALVPHVFYAELRFYFAQPAAALHQVFEGWATGSAAAADMSNIAALRTTARKSIFRKLSGASLATKFDEKSNKNKHNAESVDLAQRLCALRQKRDFRSQNADRSPSLDQTRGRAWEKLRLLRLGEQRKCRSKGPRSFAC